MRCRITVASTNELARAADSEGHLLVCDRQHAPLCVLHFHGAKGQVLTIRSNRWTIDLDGQLGSLANCLAPSNHNLLTILEAARFQRYRLVGHVPCNVGILRHVPGSEA